MPKHGTLEPYAAGTWMAMHQRVHQGETCRAVAKEFGVDNSLMRRRWDTLGLPKMDKDEAQRRRSAGCAKALLTDAEIIDKGVELNRAGLNLTQAAAVIGVNKSTLSRRMVQRCCPLIIRPFRRFKLSDAQIAEAYALYRGGVTVKELAVKYSTCRATFYHRWLKMDLPPIRARRSDYTGEWLRKRQQLKSKNHVRAV